MTSKMYALISVSDKTGIVECGRSLVRRGIGILATGGTAKLLRDNQVEVTDVESVTKFPEILNGRVKTLHPAIYGALLARRADPSHRQTLADRNIPDIRIVIVNLYPFQETIRKPDVSEAEAIEEIDIGGVSLLRAAAKNYQDILVLTDPADYRLLEGTSPDAVPAEERKALALKAWKKVLEYDLAIAKHFTETWEHKKVSAQVLREKASLVYGENPHQRGHFYQDMLTDGQPDIFTEITGKELSYNNYQDISSALFTIQHFRFDRPACAVIKHNNPCGVAIGDDMARVIALAWQGDAVSAFGSVIAVNRPVDMTVLSFLSGKFVEILCAPEWDAAVACYCRERKPKLRLIQYDPTDLRRYYETHPMSRTVVGGFLVQDFDTVNHQKWDCVTMACFPPTLVDLARFGIVVNKCITSNTISLVTETDGVLWQSGMGAGQPNRVGALEHIALPLFDRNCREMAAARKTDPAKLRAELLDKTVLISDAFFPFPDSIEIAAKHGIRYVIQPGGSKKDNDVIQACNTHRVAMVFTGTRHFRH